MRPLKAMISSYVQENQKDWDQNLDQIAFAYNTAIQATTKYSPFFLMYGRDPKIPLDLINKSKRIDFMFNEGDYVTELQNKLQSAFKIVTNNRDYKMNLAKIRYDRNVRACRFETNDQVWLQVKFVKKQRTKRLAYRWEGPYIVLKSLSDATYLIRKNIKYGKRIIVHRDRLKRHFSRNSDQEKVTEQLQSQSQNPIEEDNEHVEYESAQSSNSDSESENEQNNSDDDKQYQNISEDNEQGNNSQNNSILQSTNQQIININDNNHDNQNENQENDMLDQTPPRRSTRNTNRPSQYPQ